MPAETAPLAAVSAVSMRFTGPDVVALDDVTTAFRPGRVTGLVGPDGAGKTTLLRLVAGLLVPTSGAITTCGHDTRGDLAPIREVVSYMPQRFGLYEDLTVRENLELYADLRGVLGDERARAFDRLLEFTGLRRFTERLAGKLSGGMKQKLGLACALVRTPTLLLLDEPGVGVDPVSRRELWKMVYELVDQGIGVVWSTAYLDEAERCREIVLLNLGKVLYQGAPEELTRRAEGRTFLARGLSSGRRAFLQRALEHEAILDGVVQGQGVRLLVGEGATLPEARELGVGPEVSIEPTRPRFEDAFISLLGGVPKELVRIITAPLTTSEAGAHQESGIVVEAAGLTKRFGDFTATDHVSFSIRRGEVFGLLGPNGAGKSTTFKMMCGLLRPTEGRAQVAGVDLGTAAAEARERLGYMAQKFSLYGDLSVRQNLEFFAGIYGLAGARARAAIERMIEGFELGPFVAVNSGSLPLGFKQRLALACAIMHEPPVLFLDEPTSGVDPITRREFWGRINAMVDRGVTVMVTTHFLDEAEYCDRVALIYRGRTIAHGTPDDLKSLVRTPDRADPTLEDAFIELIERDDAARAPVAGARA